ncbi:MAG TPA: hypothetical protein VF036_06530, partial [Actinomycetota bacterium]
DRDGDRALREISLRRWCPLVNMVVLAGTVPLLVLARERGHRPTRRRRARRTRGAGAARRLERSDADRAALIGRLHVRDDAAWLAELMDLEDEVGEVARLRLVDALRQSLRSAGAAS